VTADPRDPFSTTPDSAAYVPRAATEHVLAAIAEALREGVGFVVLAGPPGLGRTLLLHVVAERLGDAFRPVHVPVPSLVPDEFFRWLVGACELRDAGLAAAPGGSAGADPAREFDLLARRAAAQGRPLLLLVDDADNLPVTTAAVLAERLGGDAALRVLLVRTDVPAPTDEPDAGPPGGGQPGTADGPGSRAATVADAFAEPPHEAPPTMHEVLASAGLTEVRLDVPMSAAECRAYIEARLERAQLEPDVLARFDAAALEALHRHSGGVPARLHVLADLLLRPAEAARAHELAAQLRPDALADALAQRVREPGERVVDWSDDDLAAVVAARGRTGVGPGAAGEGAASDPPAVPGAPASAASPPASAGPAGSTAFVPLDAVSGDALTRASEPVARSAAAQATTASAGSSQPGVRAAAPSGRSPSSRRALRAGLAVGALAVAAAIASWWAGLPWQGAPPRSGPVVVRLPEPSVRAAAPVRPAPTPEPAGAHPAAVAHEAAEAGGARPPASARAAAAGSERPQPSAGAQPVGPERPQPSAGAQPVGPRADRPVGRAGTVDTVEAAEPVAVAEAVGSVDLVEKAGPVESPETPERSAMPETTEASVGGRSQGRRRASPPPTGSLAAPPGAAPAGGQAAGERPAAARAQAPAAEAARAPGPPARKTTGSRGARPTAAAGAAAGRRRAPIARALAGRKPPAAIVVGQAPDDRLPVRIVGRAGTTVEIDGAARGEVPLPAVLLRPGTHRLVARNRDGSVYERRFLVDERTRELRLPEQ